VLCLGVIFVGSTIDFFVGRALGRVKSRAREQRAPLTSIVYYLGVLAVFKYWNFAADSFASRFAALGSHVSHVTHLRLVLPFGISFFTFETMSYTIDVWRGELPPAKRYLDYLLFVCFFPHLVAGPIVRAKAQMLPQLAADAARRCPPCRRAVSGASRRGSRRRSSSATSWRRPRQPRLRHAGALHGAGGAARGLWVRRADLRRLLRLQRRRNRQRGTSSATSCRRTSTPRMSPATCRSSGTAGTSR
jgi:hypothetical protein